MEDKSCREVWREKDCHIYWRSLQKDGLRASSQSEVWLQPGGSCLLQQSFSDLQVEFSFWDFKRILILFLIGFFLGTNITISTSRLFSWLLVTMTSGSRQEKISVRPSYWTFSGQPWKSSRREVRV